MVYFFDRNLTRGRLFLTFEKGEYKRVMFNFGFSQIEVGKDAAILVDNRTGLLGKMDLNSFEVTYFEHQSELMINKTDVCVSLLVNGDSVYIVTTDGKYIIEYDTESMTYRKYDINCNFHPWGNIAGTRIYNNRLYIFLRDKDYYVCFDLIKKSITTVNLEINSTNNKICVFDGLFVYIVECDFTAISRLDILNGNIDYFETGENLSNIVSGFVKGNSMILATKSGTIIDISISDMKYRKTISQDNDISVLVNVNDSFYSFPYENGEIRKYDIETLKQIESISYPDDYEIDTSLGWTLFTSYVITSNKIIVAMRNGNYLPVIHKDKGDLVWEKTKIINKQVWFDCIYKNKEGILDETQGNIEDYLEYLVNYCD